MVNLSEIFLGGIMLGVKSGVWVRQEFILWISGRDVVIGEM